MDPKKKAAPEDTKTFWTEIEANAVRRRITQEGVTPNRADKIVEQYKEKVAKGVPYRYAETSLKSEVLRAKRDSEVDGLVKSLAERFHLPVSVVEPLLAKSVTRLRDNPHVLVTWEVRKHEAQLERLSAEAYTNRRATSSPMAAALVKSGAVAHHKAKDS